jgi:hypothetical protein
MTEGVLLPLAVFFTMAVVVAWVLWRVMVVGGEARRNTQQARAAMDLAHRAETSLGELAAIIDDLRRRKTGPETGEASMRAAVDGLRLYVQEAEAIARRGSDQRGVVGLAVEIERAQRAVDLIEHGRQMMLDVTTDHTGEGETSVKRGYLNLVHAREAIRTRGEEIAREAEGDLSRYSRRG